MSIRGDRSLQIARRLYGASAGELVADGVDIRTEHLPADDERAPIRLIVHEPINRTKPSGALLWMHGGGLVMGAPESAHELCSRLATELGIVTVGVEYRLAPEHRFPAALDDCLDALTWIDDNATGLGVDRDRIAVGGASAGAGLAACVAQSALDNGGPSICFQLLQYPMLDDRTLPHPDDALVWTNASNRFCWAAYLGGACEQAESRPYASAARRADLRGLPPAWIGVGDIDLFHDEALDYAARLTDADVAVDLHVVAGMYHAAEHIAPNAPSMRRFSDRMIEALGNALVAPDQPTLS
jgi:acetyl esterase/lipase